MLPVIWEVINFPGERHDINFKLIDPVPQSVNNLRWRNNNNNKEIISEKLKIIQGLGEDIQK